MGSEALGLVKKIRGKALGAERVMAVGRRSEMRTAVSSVAEAEVSRRRWRRIGSGRAAG